jgi:CHC2 zinc finger
MPAHSKNGGGAAFCPELKPPPLTFYEKELGKLGRPNSKGWAAANPPCHKSKSKKSFVVNVRSGAYRCWGCGIGGGDIIDFLRWREGYSFKRACQIVGCWRDEMSAIERREREERRAKIRYERELAEQRETEKHTHVLALRDEIHTASAIYRQVSGRLSQLRRGSAEICPNEQDTCWAILVFALDDLRSSESAYSRACGLEDPYGQ